ncbi:MAG TPA: hypothetical protein VF069_29150 [Streptosporangiaceae bacterium]
MSIELEKRRQLIKAISTEQFARYEATVGGDVDLALRLYAWNIAVSGAFLGPLQVLEVSLRNALHDRLTACFAREDWWNARSLDLMFVHRQAIAAAYERIRDAGKMPTCGRVVAELSFGFWVGLLGAGANYEMTLWRPALRHAFSADVGTRKQVHHDFDRRRTFRNRIAHHESIFHRHLAGEHTHIIRLIRLICPVTAEWVTLNSRVEGGAGGATGARPRAAPDLVLGSHQAHAPHWAGSTGLGGPGWEDRGCMDRAAWTGLHGPGGGRRALPQDPPFRAFPRVPRDARASLRQRRI